MPHVVNKCEGEKIDRAALSMRALQNAIGNIKVSTVPTVNSMDFLLKKLNFVDPVSLKIAKFKLITKRN